MNDQSFWVSVDDLKAYANVFYGLIPGGVSVLDDTDSDIQVPNNINSFLSTATEKEFKASCIDKGKVLFYPGSDLRKLCKTLDYTLYKSDSSADSDKDPLPDDGDDNQGGSGSGEAPDPAA